MPQKVAHRYVRTLCFGISLQSILLLTSINSPILASESQTIAPTGMGGFFPIKQRFGRPPKTFFNPGKFSFGFKFKGGFFKDHGGFFPSPTPPQQPSPPYNPLANWNPGIGSIFTDPNVKNAPTHAKNATWQGVYGTQGLHPVFGGNYQGAINGYWINNVAPNAPLTTLPDGPDQESDTGPIGGGVGFPLSNYEIVEGAPVDANGNPIPGLATPSGSGGDQHLFIHSPGLNGRDQLAELYTTVGSPYTGGCYFDLNSNAMRPSGWTSANASGMPATPLLVKYDEAASGQINHMLTWAINHTHNTFAWPASHQAGVSADVPIMGAIIVLRQDFPIQNYSPINQTILRALQTYGAVVSDNSSFFQLLGVADKRWNDDDLHNLLNVKLSDFRFVDVSSYQVTANSYQSNGNGTMSIMSAGTTGNGAQASVNVQSHHTNSLERAVMKQ